MGLPEAFDSLDQSLLIAKLEAYCFHSLFIELPNKQKTEM